MVNQKKKMINRMPNFNGGTYHRQTAEQNQSLPSKWENESLSLNEEQQQENKDEQTVAGNRGEDCSHQLQIATGKITKHELRQGIIWSEILGSPRAKRPFIRNR